jgi:Integrase core domain
LLRQRRDGELFSTVKSEEGERFESYAHAKEALFDYIEVFYDQRRRHSTLGQISPAEFEKRAASGVDPVENRQERGCPPAPRASSLLAGEKQRTEGGQLMRAVH